MRSRVRPPAVAVLACLLGAASVSPAGAAPSVHRPSDLRQVGVPWTGRPATRTSVAEIIARDQEMPDRGEGLEQLPLLRAELHKRANPSSPGVVSTGGAPRQAARQAGLAVGAPLVGVSFEATTLSEAASIPPDTMGAVGPTQILVHVNGRVKLFDKTGAPAPAGTPLNVSDDAFWASVSGGELLTDPEVEYDPISGRWFLAIITVPISGGTVDGPNSILVAVSDGSTITATSSFDFFSFVQDTPGSNEDDGEFADFPQMGVDANAVYIGVNVFDVSGPGEDFEGTTGFVVDKADLLASTLTVTAFRALSAIGTVNCTSTGPYSPQGVTNGDPAATEGYFIGVDCNDFGLLVIRRVTDPGGTPAISGNLNVIVPSTTFPMGGVPQPSPGPLLDDIDDRLYGASITATPSGDRLWTAHNIEVNASGVASSTGGRDGSRWYEIGGLRGTPTLVQSGTLFDPSTTSPVSYWIPTIASNADGVVMIGTSQAGASPTNGFASVAVAQREAPDPAGVLGPPILAHGSSSIYNTADPGEERWGDYSQTVVDPSDPSTFWTFQEYANASGGWSIRVLSLQIGPPLPKSVTLKAKPRKVEKGEKTRLTATVTPCPGHEGDVVEFYRRSKKIATKASNDNCVAKHKVKVKRTAKFQAVSPMQDLDHLAGTSKIVKVRVKKG
jgi:hypothetical protein